MSGGAPAPMRWGLLGYGMFARWHGRFLAETPGVELAAIATTSEANRAAARADFPAARIVSDWQELVADPTIDAIDIVAPNYLHAPMAIAALEAGKTVLVEKPLATTIADCDRIMATLERTKGRLSVGFELRLSSQWAGIKRLIDEGAIGTPEFANLSLFRFPFRPGGGGWRHDPARVGSWILEEPVHFYDLLLWYFETAGEPVAVQATGRARADGLVDDFTSTITFAGGGLAVVTQSLRGFGHHLMLELVGSEGAVRSTWSAADTRSETPQFSLLLKRHGAEEEEDHTPAASGELVELRAEIEATVAAFREGRTLISAAAGRRAVRVCLEAERSLVEGRRIALE